MTLALTIAGFLTLSLTAFASEPPVTATVTLSDGTTASGALSIIGARPLTMVPLNEERQRHYMLRDIVSITHHPENASLERPWLFRESGRTDKLYLEGQYPLLNFKTTLHLVNGENISGHIISAAFRFNQQGKRNKLFLQRQIKGEIGQSIAEITYPTQIRFNNPLSTTSTLTGTVTGFGKLESATALDNQRCQIVYATTSPDNSFDFGPLLPGTYDLCLLTSTHVLTAISDATPSEATGDPLQPADLPAINQLFPLADEFFNDRWILSLHGHRGFAKTLVYMRRSDYYEADRWTPGGFLWHLEVWGWHLADTDWKLDKHYMLIRHKQKGGEANRRLMTNPTLAALTPGTSLTITPQESDNEKWTFIRNLD